jgi:hypothetical protein
MRMFLAVLFVACAAPVGAQVLFPARYVRGGLGAAEIHGSSDLDDGWFGARVGRAFGESGTFALDLGAARSSADGGFFTATVGLELRAFARRRISPFGRLELGFLNDEVGDCLVGGWGGGLSVRVTDPLSLRAGVLLCSHCSDGTGPVVASVGVEYRW